MEQIRLASIGSHGHLNLSAGIGQIEGLEYVAAASDGRSPAKVLGRQGDGPSGQAHVPVYDDYRRMLDEQRPDVVNVGVWYAHNGEVALECLRRGIHVVTDKPAVNSWEELAEAEQLAAAHPELCFITEFVFRLYPTFRAAHDAVQEGRIGQPVLVRGQKSYRFGARPDFYKQREHYGGMVLWIASHAIDYMRWASGLAYESFYGLGGNLSHPEYGTMEDHVALLARMTGGATGTVTADFLRPTQAPTHGDDRLRIAGTKGIVEIINDECTLLTNDAPPMILARGIAENVDVAREYIATLRGQGQGLFGTAETLKTARDLLVARDAIDQGEALRVG